MNGWLQFWARPHSIYVNERHLQVHSERVVADVAAALGRKPGGRILDFGCGDALGAGELARRTEAEVFLYDAVRSVRERVAVRHRATPGVTVIDATQWEVLAPASFEAIAMVSVAQYLTRAELAALLQRFRTLLRPDGVLLVADVIPPGSGTVADIGALLRPAARYGFLPAALFGLLKLFFSDYRRIRAKCGLTCYESADFKRLGAQSGFAVVRLPANIGFNRRRTSFLCRVSR